MSPVINGQAVSAEITNPAFLDAQEDDAAAGRIDLENILPESGPTVVNVQREINSLNSYTGRPAGSAFDAEPSFTNSQGFTAIQNLKDRAEELSAKFHSATGHAHDGTNGSGAPISAEHLVNVRLHGYIVQGDDILGVTGTSTDVTIDFPTEVPSISPTEEGVVVNAPQNKVVLRHASGPDEDTQFEDSLGNVVYGRLTESSGTWTLSYYSNISGVETAYDFTVATDVRWYYQELFNPLVDAPVYSEFATVPSDNQTADVIDATTTSKGKVLLSSTEPPAISATGSAGVGNGIVANADHTHQGVSGIKEFLENVPVYGDVTFKGAGATTISRSGNTFTIEAGGGLVPVQESTIPGQTPDGIRTTFSISDLPYSTDSLLVFLDGIMLPKDSWSILGTTVTISPAPVAGQDLKFYYVKASAIISIGLTPKTEFRTLTALEAAAKSINLVSAPISVGEVKLDIIGGGAQFYGDDYVVTGSTLSWAGLDLDGILQSGDRLRVQYFY